MKNPLATLFDQFLKERIYLKNVTPATIIWYEVAFKNYCKSFPGDAPPLPSRASMQQFVIGQRERGLRAVTVNTYIGAMNAFSLWLHQEGHIAERVKLSKLIVERRVLRVLDDAQMRALSGSNRRRFCRRASTSPRS